jgi:hypothetical protein
MLLSVTLWSLAGAGSLSACDPMWLPISRDAAVSPLVVRMLPDTVRDVTAPEFAPAGPVREFEASAQGARGPVVPRHGQAAEVILAGSAAMRGARILLVPWTFVEDCGPAPWPASARWAAPGEHVFVTAWPRPRRGWISETATYDVEVRGWQPTWRENDPRWPHGRDSLLTAQEFHAVYLSLPTHAELASPAGLRRRLVTLRRLHQRLIQREPARTIVANLERYLAASTR